MSRVLSVCKASGTSSKSNCSRPTMSALFAWMVWHVAPLTTDLSAWYARQGVAAALVVIGLAAYGFVVSVGAKRLALRGFLGEE